MDVYLKALVKPKCIFLVKSSLHNNTIGQIVYCRPYSHSEIQASSVNSTIVKVRVIDALMDYAIDSMTLLYNGFREHYGVNCNTADCYRALYLYKYRQYDQVLRLCERILKDSDLQNDLKEFSFANVLLLPPLNSFFDRDVQSLLDFHTLFYYLSSLNCDLWALNFEYTDKSTLEEYFAQEMHRDGSDLVFVLTRRYSMKSHYFVGRHFLARYLKLRCCIDCNLPYSDALTDFATGGSNLSFEHIIRQFILRKYCVSKIITQKFPRHPMGVV